MNNVELGQEVVWNGCYWVVCKTKEDLCPVTTPVAVFTNSKDALKFLDGNRKIGYRFTVTKVSMNEH